MSLFVCHLAGKGSDLREKGGFVQNLQDLQTVGTHGVAWRCGSRASLVFGRCLRILVVLQHRGCFA